MDRRAFLKRGLFGGALLALGGAGLALQPTRWIAEPTGPLHVLDARGFHVMVAIAARVLPFEGADHVAVAHAADQTLSRLAPEVRADIAKVLGLFENALPGLLLDGRVRPFTQLDAAAQDRVLEAWRDSSLVLRRGAYHALRRMCFIAHYREQHAWRDVGYPGPPYFAGLFYDDSKAGYDGGRPSMPPGPAGAHDLPAKDTP